MLAWMGGARSKLKAKMKGAVPFPGGSTIRRPRRAGKALPSTDTPEKKQSTGVSFGLIIHWVNTT
jgi:hypothetical protein